MANHEQVSPRYPDVATNHINTIHGQSPDGRIRIKQNGANYLITGTLSELRSRLDENKEHKWSRRLIATTPGYKASMANDKSVIAHCPKTGKGYRVTGLFKELKPKPIVSNSLPLLAQATIPLKLQFDKLLDPIEVKVKAQDSRTQQQYQRDYEVIAAQRAAGLDPDLRMSFIPAFLGESKANLYRKMGKAFPKPVKRGKGSFWPMSQIEAYKAGNSAGGAV